MGTVLERNGPGLADGAGELAANRAPGPLGLDQHGEHVISSSPLLRRRAFLVPVLDADLCFPLGRRLVSNDREPAFFTYGETESAHQGRSFLIPAAPSAARRGPWRASAGSRARGSCVSRLR